MARVLRTPDEPQADPVVLNAKGASAAGKSSIRSEQRQIATRLGLDWRDFAIISPDYWRKQLIEYSSLGADYKYAAMLTGHELVIIDQKLSRLLADNAAQGRLPHLLVDRFRAGSFQPDTQHPTAGKLLAHFGSRVYLFFLVTPPQETVVRAWTRGLETGRFKAVDDLLSVGQIRSGNGRDDPIAYQRRQRGNRQTGGDFVDVGEPQRTDFLADAAKNGHSAGLIADVILRLDVVVGQIQAYPAGQDGDSGTRYA